MKLVELRVPCLQMDQTVTAIQISEHIAIHDTIGGKPSISVTHIPTLRRMAIVEGLALAIAACEAWQMTGIDWSFTTTGGLMDMPDEQKLVARLIRDFAEEGQLSELAPYRQGVSA
jgi:hypothetical protein